MEDWWIIALIGLVLVIAAVYAGVLGGRWATGQKLWRK
jgi:hypothetical protein